MYSTSNTAQPQSLLTYSLKQQEREANAHQSFQIPSPESSPESKSLHNAFGKSNRHYTTSRQDEFVVPTITSSELRQLQRDRRVNSPISTPPSSMSFPRRSNVVHSRPQDVPQTARHELSYGTPPKVADCKHSKSSSVASSHGMVHSVDEANEQVINYWCNPEVEDLELAFQEDMAMKGCAIIEMPSDGVCLYRAIGYPLDISAQETHFLAMQFIKEHADYFSPFLEEPIDAYMARKSSFRGGQNTFGDHIELVALACSLKTLIWIHETDGNVNIIDPMDCPLYCAEEESTDCAEDTGQPSAIHLWWHGGHYDVLMPAQRC